MTDERRDLPLPSEDTGDLVETPPSGMTDDFLVASEEGVPYDPPSERAISEVRDAESGPDVAGTAADAGDELSREEGTQQVSGDLLQASLEALRRSDVAAGDRLTVAVDGTTVRLRGEVESIDVADELVGILGEVPGVAEVIDETTVGAI